MLDVRKPLGLLFIILGAVLFLYGQFISEPVQFFTPYGSFPLKLNQPVGAFMFVFGLIMWLLARYVELNTLDRELSKREREFSKVERRRRKALDKQAAGAERVLPESEDEDPVGFGEDGDVGEDVEL